MRVLIADDSVLLREGLTFILDDGGHEVIAAVGSGTELVPRALELRPELIITDIRMPPSNTDEGLRAAVEIRKKWADAPILLLSQYVVAAYVQELLADGGSRLGYLLKDRVADIDTFLDAADRVAAASCWTRRWLARCSGAAGTMTRCSSSPHGNARSWS